MKNIVDILGIAFPALIIVLEFFRLFSAAQTGRKIRVINGLIMLLAFLLLLVGLIRYLFFTGSSSHNSEPKLVPLVVSNHSELFNRSAENMLNAYYKMTDGFVNGDTTVINRSGTELKLALDSFRIDELKGDSLIYETALQPLENAKAEVASIITDPSMDEKKGSLNIFSNELFSLVSAVHYDLFKLYWLECEKAFGEDKPGNWLSKTEKPENPYGQKDCAEIKVTINHVADTTKKAGAEATK
jgi:hypothetical protein